MSGPLQVRRIAQMLAMVLTLLVAGCSDPEQGSEPAASDSPSHVVVTLPPEPPGIRMSFLQQRIWEGTRKADVRVINITDQNLAVRRIGLEWPGYPGQLQAFAADVGPGRTLDLHYLLPEPDCSVDPTTPATGIAVTGSGRTIRRDIDESGMRFLERIWGAACARLRVGRMLTLAYEVPSPATAADIPPGGGLDSKMALGLRLTRRPTSSDASPVIVDQIQGTVLFDLTLPRSGEGLGADQSAVVPLVVDPGRCDEHARSQASQPFAYRVWLRIGDDPELLSVLAVPDAKAQLRLLKFLDLACADRTAH